MSPMRGGALPAHYSWYGGQHCNKETHERKEMMQKELMRYLGRAAAGDSSTCPAALDELWHRWLVFPKAYGALCRRRFGLTIEHVSDGQGPCHGRVKEII